MSMNYYYYVGPYIKCTFHYIDKNKKYRGCPVCKRKIITGDNWCSKCGNKLEYFYITEKTKSAEFVDLYEEIDEVFSDTGEIEHDSYEILIDNIKRHGERKFHLEPTELVQEINPSDIINEKKQFEKSYKNQIDMLKKHYDSIEIKWGVVISYS